MEANNQHEPTAAAYQWLEHVEESVDKLREPRMDRVLAAARAASDMMQMIPATPTQQHAVIDELDSLWNENGVEQSILVRGKITYEVKTSTGKETHSAILWDTEVISNGFSVEALSEIDQTTRTRFGKVVHHMTVPASSIPEQFKKQEIIATADVDEVIIDTTEASVERAYSWLEAMHPEFIKAIDACTMECKSEEDVILALRSLPIADWVDLDDPLARNCVQAFLGAYATVDRLESYGLLLKGELAIINDSYSLQSSFEIDTVDMLAEVSPLRVFKMAQGDETYVWTVGVFIEDQPQDASVSRIKYAVPLSTIQDIKSVRRMYYSQ